MGGVLWYLDDADGLPGKVEAGVEQEGEDQGEGLVPAQTRDRQPRAAMSTDAPGWEARRRLLRRTPPDTHRS